MKNLILLFVLCLGTFGASAQNSIHSVTGQVFDEGRNPVAFATVILSNTMDSSMVKAGYTDDDGYFDLPGIEPGSYYIQVQYVGYNTYASSNAINVNNASLDVGLIELSIISEQLDEVVVRATKPLIEIRPDKTIFNVESSVSATGTSALELLRKSPGVVVDNNDAINLLGKSGVQVYIDGKPSPLTGADLANYLSSIQSDQIESIEIITNPTARYEAEGNAGIINIRFKKDKNLGANASINMGYNQGELARYNGSVRVNYRNQNMNVFGSYSGNFGERLFFIDFERRQEGSLYDSKSRNITDYTNHNVRGGLDIFINESHTIGALFSGYTNNNDNLGISTTDIYYSENGPLDQILLASNIGEGTRDNSNYNLNYRFTGESGQSLNVDLDYGKYENMGSTRQPNTYTSSDNIVIGFNESYFETPTNIDIYTAKLDYEVNALGGTLGIGGKYGNVITDNTFDFFDVFDDQFIKDLNRSNQFEYTENVNAGYISYQQQGEKWGFNAGLRIENTTSEGILTSIQQNDGDQVKRSYTDAFPSGGITYNLNPKNSFRLSYSRRVDRPNYQDLNPFEFKLNELAFRKGNPFLNPQYTNNYQISHTFNYRLNTTLSYSVTNDLITAITDTLNLPNGSKASYLSNFNLDQQRTLSLNVSYPFSPTKWWNVYANLTFVNLQNESEFEPGKLIDINVNTASIYNQHTFSLPHDIKFEVSGVYSTPSVWGGNFETEKYWFVDLGIQRKFLNDQLSVKVAVGDVFNSQQWYAKNNFGVLALNATGGNDSQQFRLNVGYNFGNQQVKASRQRQTGLEDEKSRISSDN